MQFDVISRAPLSGYAPAGAIGLYLGIPGVTNPILYVAGADLMWVAIAGGGGASTPATNDVLKGNGSANGVVAAVPGTDYIDPALTALQTFAGPIEATGATFGTFTSGTGTFDTELQVTGDFEPSGDFFLNGVESTIGQTILGQGPGNSPVWGGGGGITSARPVSPVTYQSYFDTTLQIPVWWTGTRWVNASGVTS